jgi:hypothetical protein
MWFFFNSALFSYRIWNESIFLNPQHYLRQCSGSVTFFETDPELDPGLFLSGFRDGNEKCMFFITFFVLITHVCTHIYNSLLR